MFWKGGEYALVVSGPEEVLEEQLDKMCSGKGRIVVG